ncbi:hypothetical protein JTB14_014580 [Gonioctena quinquepunctata]|nr:hypothetical protein JTB14_014580 [Gonioctena quinquepunctata]
MILPVISLLLALSIAFAFLDHRRYGYPSTLSGRPEEVYRTRFNKKPQWHDHFASYHANAAGSIVGLGFGYIYYATKNRDIFTRKIYVILWWILTFGLLGFITYTPIIYNVDETPTLSAIWVAMTRPVFAGAMGIFVFGLVQGQGGFFRWIFGWSPLNVLAKLSYCMYIGHTVLQNIRVGVTRTPTHLNPYSFVSEPFFYLYQRFQYPSK